MPPCDAIWASKLTGKVNSAKKKRKYFLNYVCLPLWVPGVKIDKQINRLIFASSELITFVCDPYTQRASRFLCF